MATRAFIALSVSALVCSSWGCLHAQPKVASAAAVDANALKSSEKSPSSQPALRIAPSARPVAVAAVAPIPPLPKLPAASQPVTSGATSRPATPEGLVQPSSMPASKPLLDRRAKLRQLIASELSHPDFARTKVSVVLAPLDEKEEALVAVAPDALRVPASNAKLLTSVAAAKLLGGRGFVTDVLWRGTKVYLRGRGDPLLTGRDLVALARTAKARGLRSVREVVVDDSYYGRRQLAPGFESFLAGSPYRPTSGALNVDGNSVVIKVTAARGRRRPRVDVYPPSDYVKVQKLVRYARAKRGKGARQRKIRVQMRKRGSILWLTIAGVMGRKAKAWGTRRAVYDPSLNVGWAFRRALKEQGVRVSGIARRGRTPKKARLIARRSRSLGAVLHAVNTRSHNLAAETLIRELGTARGKQGKKGLRGSWRAGLARARVALEALGIKDFRLLNGSGLHRASRVSARSLVQLLRKVHAEPRLRRAIMPTLAIGGRAGTLVRRMRGTEAEGVVLAKTGTLGNALALSGFITPEGKASHVFSILVNGTGRRRVRDRIDRLARLMVRYAKGLPLELPAASQPNIARRRGRRHRRGG